MKILIDIGHPAHVHLFRFMANKLIGKGCLILMTVREKDKNTDLIRELGYPYEVYGVTKKNVFQKIISIFFKTLKLLEITIKYKPDITISHSSFYLSQVSWLLRIPNITLEDTGNMEQVRLYLPFTSVILTPSCYTQNHGKKQIWYDGYHELAYLHPNVRQTLLNTNLGLPFISGKPVILIRLVSWSASHDINRKGISPAFVTRFIKEFELEAQIYISAECNIPEPLEKYRINSGNPGIHAFLNKITMYLGEGATMASECAMLGKPAIYTNDIRSDTINDQVKAGLIIQTTDENEILEVTRKLLMNKNSEKEFGERAEQLLRQKIDVSEFLEWFVENYPVSKDIMLKNPEYQNRFKA